MKVAVLGLGEAGSLFAFDLARHGDEVHGYDPAPVQNPVGVFRAESPQAAVEGCELVLAATHASQALSLIEAAATALDRGTIYADLSTGSPGLKEKLATFVAEFADVALMAPVPGRGLATPSLVSGSGAIRYAEMINARGGRVEVVSNYAGAAARRKLLRSVVMKGLAALLIESTEAAARVGEQEWFWAHLREQLGAIDEDLMTRLVEATPIHAGRRIEEMEAARALLGELGLPATMTNATIAQLRRLARKDDL